MLVSQIHIYSFHNRREDRTIPEPEYDMTNDQKSAARRIIIFMVLAALVSLVICYFMHWDEREPTRLALITGAYVAVVSDNRIESQIRRGFTILYLILLLALGFVYWTHR